MAEIRELVLTFLERLSHHALPKNRKRETLDACISNIHTETQKETNSADISSVEKFVASAKRVSRRGCLDVQSIH